jgi:Bacterial cell division membrane protein
MGEEFGLVGICALLLIYLLLIGRGLVITAQAQTLFGKLLAGSLTMTFLFMFSSTSVWSVACCRWWACHCPLSVTAALRS